MNIAIFDLDNTLLPIDSDHEWNNFLISKKNNILTIKDNNKWFDSYNNGTLDPIAYLKFNQKIILKIPEMKLKKIYLEYIKNVISPVVLNTTISLLNKHFKSNDIVILSSATNYFLVKPIANILKIKIVIAAPLYINKFSPNFDILHNYGEGKVKSLNLFLKKKNMKLNDFNKSYFYSDSLNDIPLLSLVTNPIVVNAKKNFLNYAKKKNWKILNIFKC